MKPPAIMEEPAMTTGIPSAVHAHLVGEERCATQVRQKRNTLRFKEANGLVLREILSEIMDQSLRLHL